MRTCVPTAMRLAALDHRLVAQVADCLRRRGLEGPRRARSSALSRWRPCHPGRRCSEISTQPSMLPCNARVGYWTSSLLSAGQGLFRHLQHLAARSPLADFVVHRVKIRRGAETGRLLQQGLGLFDVAAHRATRGRDPGSAPARRTLICAQSAVLRIGGAQLSDVEQRAVIVGIGQFPLRQARLRQLQILRLIGLLRNLLSARRIEIALQHH